MPIIRQHTVGVAAVLFDREGFVCLQDRIKHPGYGLMVLPGGRLDESDPYDGICREIKEELDLDLDHPFKVTYFGQIGFAADYSVPENPFIMLYYGAVIRREHVQNMEPEKCKDLHWHHYNKLPANMWDNDKQAIVQAANVFWEHF